MKNIIISFLLILSPLSSYAQQSVEEKKQDKKSEEVVEESFITHEDINLSVGNLKLAAPFLLKGEVAPHQGYLIKLGDMLKVQSLAESFNTGCDIMVSGLVDECNSNLFKCQQECNERVVFQIKEKDAMKLKLDVVQKDLSLERKYKYIWIAGSLVVGAGIGSLIYTLAK